MSATIWNNNYSFIKDEVKAMIVDRTAIFQNREHAAHLLGERLMVYKNADAVVVAVSGGGIHIGAYLAKLLQLRLEVIPCRKIKNPADEQKTIGAVSAEAVVFHEEEHNIPQDYIYHQIQLMQHAIQRQCKRYHKETLRQLLEDRIIILVDDLVMTGDTMLASIRTIRNYGPLEIIVAVPIVTPEGTRAIADEMDKILYLTIEPQPMGRVYKDFPDVAQEEVLEILRKSRSRTNPGEEFWSN
ncbi:MAG: phosphoribosyltransferase family protein [Cyclobacteriaceae bacterium]|nr:phosphoribosyltransferase family protein [Cyclobacteriaceae bacterium]